MFALVRNIAKKIYIGNYPITDMEPHTESEKARQQVQNIVHQINDVKLRDEILSLIDEARDNNLDQLSWNRSGNNIEAIVDKLLLPNEQIIEGSQLKLAQLQKEYNHSIEELRIGLVVLRTNLRLIFVDVEADYIPKLQKNHSRLHLENSEDYIVGHSIKENIYFQPIEFRNLLSIDIDINNTVSQEYNIRRTRSLELLGFVVLLLLSALLISPDTFWGILPFVGGIGLLSFLMLRFSQIYQSYEDNQINRDLRLGMIDPISMNKSVWRLSVDDRVTLEYILHWTSELQLIINQHSRADVVPNLVVE